MNKVFDYRRIQVSPRLLLSDDQALADAVAARAGAAGGRAFGLWKSLVGLGLHRDEAIALTSWPDRESLDRAIADGCFAGIDGVEGAEAVPLLATVRPTDDAPPLYRGVYVFRWFDVAEADWPEFLALSDEAWPNMESVYDVNIVGFWKALEAPRGRASVLLLTRYADLSVWEASRWWKAPADAAQPSMQRFRRRNDLVGWTLALPGLPVLPEPTA